MYEILADTVVLIHLFWILFLITGAYWGRRHRPVMFVHIGGLSFAIAMQIFGWFCPLTHLEVWLRNRQGSGSGYPGSFIAYYSEKLVYLEVTGGMILAGTVILVAANGWLYRQALKKRYA